MTFETARVEAFSDGVFAIAITLLILEIKVPASGQTGLGAALLHEWPSYLAFGLSFAYIGIMWINHHRLFTQIRRCEDGLLILNLLLLLGITFVPYPTHVLAEYLGSRDQKVAALFYNGTYIAIAIVFNALWHYARVRRLVDQNASASAAISRQYAFGPIVYAACFVLAWVSVGASLAMNVALALFFAIPPDMLAKRRQRTGGIHN